MDRATPERIPDAGPGGRRALIPVRRRYSLRWPDGSILELGSRTLVMGVLNITPESFSDGRPDLSPDALLPLAEAMLEAGADLLDVGGESTRPGAAEVAGAVEIGRVVPVIHAIKSRLAVRISVDTRKAEVARAAIDAGADMINDVTALSDASMGSIAARARVPVVLMHMRGTPRTMQVDTHYDDLMGTLIDYLGKAADRARAAGVADDKILVDPGIGFGKSPSGSLQILRELPALGRVGEADRDRGVARGNSKEIHLYRKRQNQGGI